MTNAVWGVNLPPRDTSLIALDYEVRILGIDESMANFIYAVKTMRDYARATFGEWSPTGGASLCGLKESKDFCEAIRGEAKKYTAINMTVSMPVGSDSRAPSMVALCGVLGTLGIAYHIAEVRDRRAGG